MISVITKKELVMFEIDAKTDEAITWDLLDIVEVKSVKFFLRKRS